MNNYTYILGEMSFSTSPIIAYIIIPFFLLLIILLMIKIIGIFKKDNKQLEKTNNNKTKLKEIPIKKTDQIDDPAMVRFDLEAKQIMNNNNSTTPVQANNTSPQSPNTEPEKIEELI